MWKYGIKMAFWFLAMIIIVGFVVMELWNWLIPEIFNGNTINYWQALGVLMLARLLTGFGKSSMGHWKNKMSSSYKMSRGWSSMSDEDKDRMREKFKDRWCKSEEE